MTDKPKRRWYQFSLRSMFVVTAALAVVLSVSLVVTRYHADMMRRQRIHWCFRQIFFGLVDYDSANARLPPASLRDDTGQALSSWRFQILPYGTNDYWQFKYDRAWDDSANRDLAAKPCFWFCFASINGPQERQRMTNVLAISGPDTAFDPERRRRFSDLDPDTILMVETNNSSIHWMQPGDLDVSKIPESSDKCADVGISGSCRDGFFVGFADQTVWMLSNRTPLSVLKKFFTISGSKSHSRDKVLAQYKVW